MMHVILVENSLVGYIPTEIGYLTNLLKILFNDNVLSGTIPIEIALLNTTLTEMQLGM